MQLPKTVIGSFYGITTRIAGDIIAVAKQKREKVSILMPVVILVL
jgi:hypothetical protein